MDMIFSRMREMINRNNSVNSNGDCLMYCHFLSLIKKLIRRVITKKPAMISSRINRFIIHLSDKWNPNFKKNDVKAAIPKAGVIMPVY